MAKVIFDVGDRFVLRTDLTEPRNNPGFGIVLHGERALVIRGPGGRTLRTIIREPTIPKGALPVGHRTDMPYEVQFALDAVETALIG